MMWKFLVVTLLLGIAGCPSDDGDNCPSGMLPCTGGSVCCTPDAPIYCGGSCWNTMPSAAQCMNQPIDVCTLSNGGSPCVSGSYCYQWICFGDPECVSTNPNGTAVGANDEGNDPSCAGLLMFGEQFWSAPAWQSCMLVP